MGDGKLEVRQFSRNCLRQFFLSHSVLLRKEVIQPHLPIRLPCYDFTPITSPTFDGCLPLGCEKWDVGCGTC